VAHYATRRVSLTGAKMAGKRVIVNGGGGFLGSFVVDRLQRTEWCAKVFAPRSREYDLREQEAVVRLYTDVRPHIVIHLAGVLGGSGPTVPIRRDSSTRTSPLGPRSCTTPTCTASKSSSPSAQAEDCAEAIVLATERYDKPDPVNIGAGVEISIQHELLQPIIRQRSPVVPQRN